VLIICRYFTFALVLAPMLSGQPTMRLQGLDRLYFEHVGGNGDQSEVPSFLVEFLPPKIQESNFSSRKAVREVLDGKLKLQAEIRDFHLPLGQTADDLWLRQISVGTETARISQLWWALYDRGQRSDVWYFTADPEHTDSKLLSNYEIDAASATADGLRLQVYGSMFRPQGAWWITGKTFSFSMQDGTLRFSRVLNDFGFFRDYDVGDKPPSLDVSTEHEVNGRFQTKNYDNIREPILRTCRFHDPLVDNNWQFDWARMERETRCIANRMKGRVSYRNFNQPSFVERGGKLSTALGVSQ